MRRASYERGVSLIETVVWISVFTSAMLALTTSVIYFYRTSNYTIQQASATVSAQRGIDLMIRTAREASYASNGAYPVVSLAGDDLRFYADIDGDFGIEQIHYYLSGTSLMRGVIEPSGDPAVYTGVETVSIVSQDVRNIAQSTAIFTFYDKNGTLMNDYARIGDVRYISARLLIDVDPNKTPTPIYLNSSAALRNLVGH